MQDIDRNGYNGIGKPELLKGELSGFASRRIDETNRLVYRISGDVIEILSCNGHYEIWIIRGSIESERFDAFLILEV